MTSYDAVLFDNDGVLVEPPSRETQLEAIRTTFGSLGVEAPPDEHVRALAGSVTLEGVEEVATHHGLDTETLWVARDRHDERSQLEQFRAGERRRYEDVVALEEIPVPTGVVSNNHHSTVAFVLERFGLDRWMDTYHGRPMTVESIELKKPNPHYLEQALSVLGVERGRVLYVGDSESDVFAAERAGIDSAFLRRTHNREATLATDPTHEVRDLHGVADIAAGESTP